MLDVWVQDLRYALRCLAARRSFTAAALAALALGIGANTAIFSVVDAVAFRPLPYPDSSRLVSLRQTDKGKPTDWIRDEDFRRWAERNRSFETMAGWRVFNATLTGRAEPERLLGGAVTPGFFALFGARMSLGRGFLPQEDRPGEDRVVILSHDTWRRRFASDTAVLGRAIRIDTVPHVVIGVLGAGFEPVLPGFPRKPELYVTMSHTLREARPGRWFTMFNAGGCLRPGIAMPQAQAEMSAIAAALEKETPRQNAGMGIELSQLAGRISAEARPAIAMLLGAVGCVLLICCANVANLLLARAAARQREISLRTALGAGRGRLLRQWLTESMVLAAAGGASGVLVARWGVALLVAAMPAGTLPRIEDVVVDLRVLAFSLALSLLTGAVVGMAPAVEAMRWSSRGLAQALREAGTAVAGARGARLRNALVVAEVAAALVLLTGAGLLVRTFLSLRAVDLGFRAETVLTAAISLPNTRYPDEQSRGEFVERALERIQHISGVESAALTNSIPVSPAFTVGIGGFEIQGVTDDTSAAYRTVTPDYFRIMGIPLKKGRLLTAPDARRGAIVNEAFVRRYWPREPANSREPLGRAIKFRDQTWEIVGVVGDVKFWGAKSQAEPELYVPHTANIFPNLALVVRASAPPARIVPELKRAVLAVDRDQPLERIATMDEVIAGELATPRFHMLLLVCFAALALVLAAVGIYGVVAYSVAQRTRETGIRMALGASPAAVLGAVLREAGLLAAAGVLAGIALAAAGTRVLSALLFGVRPADPLTFAAVAALLVGVALLAAWIPARRATRVDPSIALRCE